jgi:hypothetical protein
MVDVAKVFGGMFVLGRVTATDVAAGHAQAQVNPGVAELYAFFADVRFGGGDFNLVEMLALG